MSFRCCIRKRVASQQKVPLLLPTTSSTFLTICLIKCAELRKKSNLAASFNWKWKRAKNTMGFIDFGVGKS